MHIHADIGTYLCRQKEVILHSLAHASLISVLPACLKDHRAIRITYQRGTTG